VRALAGLVLAWALALPAAAQDAAAAKAIYESSCAACHGSGILGAPKFGDAAMWAPRAKAGIAALVKSAAAGTPKGMPPKGGRMDLTDAQLRATIEYMIAGGAPAAAARPAPAPAPAKAAAAAPAVPPPAGSRAPAASAAG
jgi:cytochrome c5